MTDELKDHLIPEDCPLCGQEVTSLGNHLRDQCDGVDRDD